MSVSIDKTQYTTSPRATGRQLMSLGRVEMLVALLTQRFGPIAAPHRERLDRATTEQLQAVVENFPAATSADELLASLDC